MKAGPYVGHQLFLSPLEPVLPFIPLSSLDGRTETDFQESVLGGQGKN